MTQCKCKWFTVTLPNFWNFQLHYPMFKCFILQLQGWSEKNSFTLTYPYANVFGKVKIINEIGFIKEITHDASSVP